MGANVPELTRYPEPMQTLTPERFDELVAEALDDLPAWVLAAMDNVEVLVEDRPPPGQPTLLGLYHGIPLSERGSGYTNVLPDTITLYRSTIVGTAGATEDAVRRQVVRTVAHEVAHHFGISDDRLREIDAY
jgi:predicted Zn-dependent protease with MMP-like domain